MHRSSFAAVQTGTLSGLVAGLVMILFGVQALAQSPAAATLKLLQSGRVPPQRLPAIVKLVCDRGEADDLAYIFSEAIKEDHWSEELRVTALNGLATATLERKIIPSGDLSGVTNLMTSSSPSLQTKAIELAGEWKVAAAAPKLVELATGSDAPLGLRRQALQALAQVAPDQARELIAKLSAPQQPFELRAAAISVLARMDVAEAAKQAATLLSEATPEEDTSGILVAFLDLNQGSKVLAEQLKSTPPEKDVARLMLRRMYALGRTDPELNQVLSAQAGMNQAAAPPTKEEVDALVKEVLEKGNPARGEMVFRRKDLSCLNCHAVSKAGGDIGPDLSAIGSSSPVEYLVTSVLDPDQAIKEAYISKTVLTSDGLIVQGIVADRTRDTLVLKDATGKTVSIPLDDIEDEVEGKSLMPKGLVNFMTHSELLDLIAFLSELGKPGEYAIRSGQRMQRYRVLEQAPAAVLEHVPTQPVFEEAVLNAPLWGAAYAMVNGNLPLEELAEQTHSRVLYIRGDVNCTESGAVTIRLNSAAGVTLWLDEIELSPVGDTFTADLKSGQHAITARIDLDQRPSAPFFRMELEPAKDSAVEFTVVDGR